MQWLGADITDRSGERYGRLEEIFVGSESGRPQFGMVSLRGGADREERVAVPLEGARSADDGTLVLDVDRKRVLDAPRVRRNVERIPPEAGRLIRDHFGVSQAGRGSDEDAVLDRSGGDSGELGRPHRDDAEGVEVIRREEELTVGTRTDAAERIRVRRRVVTENVTLTVALRREELVIEREPIDADSASGETVAVAESAFAADGNPTEFVLHAEEPVVTKRIVPVERVRLHRETTTEQREVAETVRKERVDVEQEELTPTREDRLR